MASRSQLLSRQQRVLQMCDSDRQVAFNEYLELFRSHGETHIPYLTYHWPRFLKTKSLIEESRSLSRNTRVLDLGAHWLHQTALYSMSGCQVTAADMPLSMVRPCTLSLAKHFGIQLHRYESLEDASALEGLPSDSYDIVLFSEVLEHLTCNPVNLWKGVHRVLKTGGVIVVTTPNYYYWRSLYRSIWRLLTGHGVGIDMRSLVTMKTTAPHWKEYSMSELREYFRLLSPDFEVTRTEYVEMRGDDKRPIAVFYHWVESCVPPFRKNLHVEITLKGKGHGIQIEPYW